MYQDQENLINAVQQDWDAAHADSEALFEAQLSEEIALKESIDEEAQGELEEYWSEKTESFGAEFVRVKSECGRYTYVFDASDTSIVLHALYFPLSNEYLYLLPERVERDAIALLRSRIK